MLFHLLASVGFAADVVVELPIADWKRTKLSVYVEGEPKPRKVRCRSGQTCRLEGVPHDEFVFFELDVPGEDWASLYTPGREPKPDVTLAFHRYPNPNERLFTFVDLEGRPVPTGRYGLSTTAGVVAMKDWTSPVQLTTGVMVEREDAPTEGRRTVLPVRRLPEVPEHLLIGEGQRLVPTRRSKALTTWFGAWLPVGTWFEEWVDDEGAHRRRWDVPAEGPITIEDEPLQAVRVTWPKERRLEPEHSRLLLVEDAPGEGRLYPRFEDDTPQVVKWSGLSLVVAPGQEEATFRSILKVGCLDLDGTPEGLFVRSNKRPRYKETPGALASVGWGWVLTAVDDHSTAGWSRDRLWAELSVEPHAAHRFTFDTVEGPVTLESTVFDACPRRER